MRLSGYQLQKQKRFRRFGFYSLLLDYFFIIYILFRMRSVGYIFTQTVDKPIGMRAISMITYGYVIPVFDFPVLLLLFLVATLSADYFKEEASVWKTTRVYILKKTVLPTILAFLFSGLFVHTIQNYLPRIPEQFQDNAIFAYYLTFIIMTLYFFVRTVFTFDYYQACYLKDKKDFRLMFTIIYLIILALFISSLPYSIFL